MRIKMGKTKKKKRHGSKVWKAACVIANDAIKEFSESVKQPKTQNA